MRGEQLGHLFPRTFLGEFEDVHRTDRIVKDAIVPGCTHRDRAAVYVHPGTEAIALFILVADELRSLHPLAQFVSVEDVGRPQIVLPCTHYQGAIADRHGVAKLIALGSIGGYELGGFDPLTVRAFKYIDNTRPVFSLVPVPLGTDDDRVPVHRHWLAEPVVGLAVGGDEFGRFHPLSELVPSEDVRSAGVFTHIVVHLGPCNDCLAGHRHGVAETDLHVLRHRKPSHLCPASFLFALKDIHSARATCARTVVVHARSDDDRVPIDRHCFAEVVEGYPVGSEQLHRLVDHRDVVGCARRRYDEAHDEEQQAGTASSPAIQRFPGLTAIPSQHSHGHLLPWPALSPGHANCLGL